MAVRLRRDIAYQLIGDRVAVLSSSHRCVHFLNETGTDIFRMAVGGLDPEAIADRLSRSYGEQVPDRDSLRFDVDDFLASLATKGILDPLTRGSGTGTTCRRIQRQTMSDSPQSSDGKLANGYVSDNSSDPCAADQISGAADGPAGSASSGRAPCPQGMENDVLGSIRDAAEGINQPIDVLLELTRQCNVRCLHCYAAREAGRAELTTDELLTLIDQVAEAGALLVTLTGGEPLLRNDFFELALRVRSRHMALQIFTNGTFIDGVSADRIAELFPLKVGVSVLGADAQTHEGITGAPGSFAGAISAIELLRDRGVHVVLKCTLMTENIDQYDDMLALAGKLGVAANIDPIVVPADDGSQDVLSHRIDRDSLARLLEGKRARAAADSSISSSFSAEPADPEEFICGAGKNLASISAYGDVRACLQIVASVGNVRERSFEEIWRESPELRKIRAMRLSDLKECSACALRPGCSRCPGLAELEDGDILGPSSIACEAARIMKDVGNRSGSHPPA